MKDRFEQLERANFVRPDPKQTSFILRAFPEETGALKQEWLTNLGKLVGTSRAELLDQFVRTNQIVQKAGPSDLKSVLAGKAAATSLPKKFEWSPSLVLYPDS